MSRLWPVASPEFTRPTFLLPITAVDDIGSLKYKSSWEDEGRVTGPRTLFRAVKQARWTGKKASWVKVLPSLAT